MELNKSDADLPAASREDFTAFETAYEDLTRVYGVLDGELNLVVTPDDAIDQVFEIRKHLDGLLPDEKSAFDVRLNMALPRKVLEVAGRQTGFETGHVELAGFFEKADVAVAAGFLLGTRTVVLEIEEKRVAANDAWIAENVVSFPDDGLDQFYGIEEPEPTDPSQLVDEELDEQDDDAPEVEVEDDSWKDVLLPLDEKDQWYESRKKQPEVQEQPKKSIFSRFFNRIRHPRRAR